MNDVYSSAEDSYFFADFLDKYLSKYEGEIDFLDMGTGSGILCKVALKHIPKSRIFAADINERAVDNLKNEGFNTLKTDLFSDIKGSFDLITFNAPYLPLDKREPIDSRLATTGGEKGDEISLEFLSQAQNHLNDDGKILLLVSSLTPMEEINKFHPKRVAEIKLFMESLYILEFEKSKSTK